MSRVPIPATRLLGREVEMELLTNLLGGGTNRLVTITGPGGCGKTRLAVELARTLAGRYEDGVVFVGLGDLRDPGLVAAEVARALGGEAAGGSDALVNVLQYRNQLLVLDNFEHVVEAAPIVAGIVSNCADVQVVVTSRRPLQLGGEHTIGIGPLRLPGPDAPSSPTSLELAPSVALFCERASAVNSQFVATAESLESIAEVCRLLDGLPLAIELAAAYVRVLPPDALLVRLQSDDGSRRFELLGRGAPDAMRHHRGLRATIGWSHDLLDDPARQLLRRLAVFDGGWSLDGMERACAERPDEPLLDALADLVDLHLVEPSGDVDGAPRFRLLETVRRFALERLDESGEASMVRDRHTDHFVALALEAGRGMQSGDEAGWVRRVEAELPNLRAALDRLHADGRFVEGLRASSALGPFWLDRGPVWEGRQLIERFLAAAPDPPPTVAAEATGWSVRLELESLETAATAEDDADPIVRLDRAVAALAEARDRLGWLRAMDHLTYGLRLRGDSERLDSLIDEALSTCDTVETDWLHAELLFRASLVAREAGRTERALALAAECSDVAKRAGNERTRVRAAMTLALLGGGDPDTVRRRLSETVEQSEAVGDRRGMAMATGMLGALSARERDTETAARWYLRSIELGRQSGYWHAIGWGTLGLVSLAAHSGHAIEAAQLHGTLKANVPVLLRSVPPSLTGDYDKTIAKLRARIGDAEFNAHSATGATMNRSQAVNCARALGQRLATETAVPQSAPRRRRGPRANPELTDREREVLTELVRGLTNHDIAVTLQVAPKTVMHHTMNVYRKLGVRGRAEAITHALRTGLVPT